LDYTPFAHALLLAVSTCSILRYRVRYVVISAYRACCYLRAAAALRFAFATPACCYLRIDTFCVIPHRRTRGLGTTAPDTRPGPAAVLPARYSYALTALLPYAARSWFALRSPRRFTLPARVPRCAPAVCLPALPRALPALRHRLVVLLPPGLPVCRWLTAFPPPVNRRRAHVGFGWTPDYPALPVCLLPPHSLILPDTTRIAATFGCLRGFVGLV